MSSKPSDGKKQAPPAEKKTIAGPVITPQILGIVFGVILLAGIIAFYQMVVVKFTNEMNQLNSQISSEQQRINTYTKKGGMKDDADEINKALKAKLGSMGYLFLEDQSSLIPFWEGTFAPIIENGTLRIGADTKIKAKDPYFFYLNMAMNPFKTLPGVRALVDPLRAFPIEYQGERDGVPIEEPYDTRPNSFLFPYTIEMEGLIGTYRDVRRFVEMVQLTRTDEFITVHCIANDKDKNSGAFRVATEWTIIFTVYFMNPEASANSENPPGLPSSESC